jgi:hypothetical protein
LKESVLKQNTVTARVELRTKNLPATGAGGAHEEALALKTNGLAFGFIFKSCFSVSRERKEWITKNLQKYGKLPLPFPFSMTETNKKKV